MCVQRVYCYYCCLLFSPFNFLLHFPGDTSLSPLIGTSGLFPLRLFLSHALTLCYSASPSSSSLPPHLLPIFSSELVRFRLLCCFACYFTLLTWPRSSKRWPLVNRAVVNIGYFTAFHGPFYSCPLLSVSVSRVLALVLPECRLKVLAVSTVI